MKISLVYAKQFDNIHRLLVKAFEDVLNEMGHEVSINYVPNADNSDVEINFYPLYYDIFEKKKNKTYIMLQMEQLVNTKKEMTWQLEYTIKRLQCYDIVWDVFYDFHKKLYKITEAKAMKFTLGYHKFFDRHNLDIKKEYDASFIGRQSPKRSKALRSLKQFDFFQTQKVSESERFKIINKSKININLHNHNHFLLETLRVVTFTMSNRGLVLTENFAGDDELKKYDCLVVARKEDFPYRIKDLLKTPGRMDEIAQNGYNYVRRYRTLKKSITKCIKDSL